MSTPHNPNPGDQPSYDAYRYPAGDAGQPTDFSQPAYGGSAYAGGPGGSTWAVDEERNRVAPWALGLGIVAVILGLSLVFSALAFIAGIIGVILALVAISKGRRLSGPGRRTGMSVTGLVLSIIGIGLSVVFWVLLSFVFTETGVADCMSITDQGEQQQCIQDSIDEWMGNGR